MDFNTLASFIKKIDIDYGVIGCDISVYYNHINVFRGRSGFSDDSKKVKISGKSLYFMNSGAKIMCSAAIMQLAQQFKIGLNDKVSDYTKNEGDSFTVKELIGLYSKPEHGHDKYFDTVRQLIEGASGLDFDEFISKNITGPLKMKSSFTLDKEKKKLIEEQYKLSEHSDENERTAEGFAKKRLGCLITSVDDYAKFCEALCSGGISKWGKRILNKESAEALINDLVYTETEKDGAFVSIGYNGSLVLIDMKKKISIVYAQRVKSMENFDLSLYPKMRKSVYECIGADTWSLGYNVFP